MQSVSALLPPSAVQTARAALIRQALPSVESYRVTTSRWRRPPAGFDPASFAPFSARLPRLVAADPLTLDDFATHGFGDIFGRFLVKAEDQWLLATYAFPSDPAEVAALGATVAARSERIAVTGMAPVNQELSARFGPEFLKGLSVGTAIVIGLLLATFRSCASCRPGVVADRHRAGLGGRDSRRRWGRAGSLCPLRGDDLRRHRRRLRHSPHLSV